jgi:hypothetical protein
MTAPIQYLRERPPPLKRIVEKADGTFHRTLLTPERHTIIVEAFINGASLASAASYANISPQSVNDWRSKGQEAIRLEEKDEPIGHLIIYADFERDVQAALGKFEKEHVENIEEHSKAHWTASKFLLEKRLPKEWGPKREKRIASSNIPQKLEVTLNLGELRGTPNPPIEVDHAVVENSDPILISPPERETGKDDGSRNGRKPAD